MNGHLSPGQDVAEIGARLTAARTARGLSIEQVAETLLLSKTQVAGLEQGNLRTFYNAGFYRQALRKYAALVGVDAEPAVFENSAAKARSASAFVPEAAGSARAASVSPWRRPAVPMLAAFVALVIAAGYWLTGKTTTQDIRTAQIPDAAPPPTTPLPVAPPAIQAPEPAATPDTPVEQVSTVVTAPTGVSSSGLPAGPVGEEAGGYGRVDVAQSTWIFVRYANGEVVERSLARGESYVLTTTPAYLAVGTTDARLLVAGRAVDTTPWISNGQLRLGAQAFASSALQPAVLVR